VGQTVFIYCRLKRDRERLIELRGKIDFLGERRNRKPAVGIDVKNENQKRRVDRFVPIEHAFKKILDYYGVDLFKWTPIRLQQQTFDL